MVSDTPENRTKLAIKKYLATRSDVVLDSNASGMAYVGKLIKHNGSSVVLGFARRMSFGVFSPGGPDMIGIKTIIISKDMVGQKIGQFVGVEIKKPEGGRLTVEQAEVIGMINMRGGLSGVVTSVDDLIQLLGKE